MHGRLKVKTTAEQEKAKEIERDKKIKKFTGATRRIFEKRKDDEKDQEGIDITGQVLSSNPDFYTLWNIRREIFEHWIENRTETELQNVFENELDFLEFCLRTNPKSYGSWYHRCWVMENMPTPDWNKELLLCNKYLEYDERNFHCWDYRRFVVKKSNISAQDEFQYTTDKISSNFSNYSSWHYRSKLMPIIYPDPKHPIGVKESVLLDEFELAQNAFFTDPNDQSAWFYHRWLLGRGDRLLGIKTAVVDRNQCRCILVLNKEIQTKNVLLKVTVDNTEISMDSVNFIGPNQHSKLWEVVLDPAKLSSDVNHSISIMLKTKSDDFNITLELKSDEARACWRQSHKQGTRFNYELSAATTDILTQELESCQQLHELEPDNKWTLLTIVLLMRAINPLNYEKETQEYLSKLEAVDATRYNYYKDMRSKFIIENIIERLDEPSSSIDLSGQGLTALFHMEELCHLEAVDISNNQITNFNELYYLQCVKTLRTNENPILLSQENVKYLPNISLN